MIKPDRLILPAMLLAMLFLSATRAEQADHAQATAAAQDVLRLFHAKCMSCHDAATGRSDGGFDYVMDLQRLAGNADLIVPFEPDQSELWFILDFDDMPPANSDVEPLTDAEKQAVRQWISLGAVAVARPADLSPPVATPSESTAASRDRRELPRWLRWIGRWHPASVHVPIAMTLAALLAEVLGGLFARPSMRHVVRFCLWFGLAGAVLSAGLGWIHAESGVFVGQRADVLERHRWLGIGTTVWLLLTVVLQRYAARSMQGSRLVWVFRAALLIAAVLASLTGHLGGALTHGLDYYRW